MKIKNILEMANCEDCYYFLFHIASIVKIAIVFYLIVKIVNIMKSANRTFVTILTIDAICETKVTCWFNLAHSG